MNPHHLGEVAIMENAEFRVEDVELLHEVVYQKYPGR